jgi:hypothetical protein
MIYSNDIQQQSGGEPDSRKIISRTKCLNKDIVALPQQAESREIQGLRTVV